ncbi:Alpha/beta hydrolase family [Mycobacteroides abscessus subsp. abscessus]|nr:Alpha/beta hydrolase family [Mycobacteroides abscessus subsp. abscessus]
MLRQIPVVLALVATLCCVSSCSRHELNIVTTDLGVPNTLGLSAGHDLKGLVVYFHGSDQNARVIQDDTKHADFFKPVLRAGYAVVAADADGNAYGNLKSRDDYRTLIEAALKKYGAAPVFFVAESMGALAALALLREDIDHRVKGMVGVTPLMALPPAARQISFILGAWGGTMVPNEADPVTWPDDAFGGRKFRLYHSGSDAVVPDIAGAVAFDTRFARVADITMVNCKGGHVAPDCYRGDDVAKWMSEL